MPNVSSGIIVGIEAFSYLSTYKVMKRFLDVNQAKIDMNMTKNINLLKSYVQAHGTLKTYWLSVIALVPLCL